MNFPLSFFALLVTFLNLPIRGQCKAHRVKHVHLARETNSSTTSHSSLSLPSPTGPRPIGDHNGSTTWYPANGTGVEVYKWALPDVPRPFTSSGGCVSVHLPGHRNELSGAWIISSLRMAPGLRCEFYYLDYCEQALSFQVDEAGYWNASNIWKPPIFSSFLCWPKQCQKPEPEYTANQTVLCESPMTSMPVGTWTHENFKTTNISIVPAPTSTACRCALDSRNTTTAPNIITTVYPIPGRLNGSTAVITVPSTTKQDITIWLPHTITSYNEVTVAATYNTTVTTTYEVIGMTTVTGAPTWNTTSYGSLNTLKTVGGDMTQQSNSSTQSLGSNSIAITTTLNSAAINGSSTLQSSFESQSSVAENPRSGSPSSTSQQAGAVAERSSRSIAP